MESETTLSPHVEQESHRERVLELVLELVLDGKIKYSEKYIKKAPESTLERIFKEYERKQLEETNAKLSDELVQKFSELLSYFKVVENEDTMKKESVENKLFKDDLKKILSYITPYVPFVGLLSGGITVGKHMLGKKKEPKEE